MTKPSSFERHGTIAGIQVRSCSVRGPKRTGENQRDAWASARGIPVANVPGSNRQAVAEHVATCLGLLARRLHRMDATLRRDGWDASRAYAGQATELTTHSHSQEYPHGPQPTPQGNHGHH